MNVVLIIGYTRCVPKIPGIFDFTKKNTDLFTIFMSYSSKQSHADIIHISQSFFQSSNFVFIFSSYSDALLMSSMVVMQWPFKVFFFITGNRISHTVHVWWIWRPGHYYIVSFGQKFTYKCEQVRCRDTEPMNCFSKNPGVFFKLLQASGIEFH